MTDESKPTTRPVVAPSNAGSVTGGQVLSVEAGLDEEVKWIWSHDPERGSFVTGYRIVPRVGDPKQVTTDSESCDLDAQLK
jgi:hypothetical protein